jgi:hypothetical protein
VNDSAKSIWAALDRRLNSPAGFRGLVSIFIVLTIAFSAVPLLHYFRGRSIIDYKLWHDTGKYVLAGDEIFSFAPGSTTLCIPRPARCCWQGRVCWGKAD